MAAPLEPDADSESPDPARQRALAAAKQARGDALGALAHLIAAQALEAHAAAAGAGASGEANSADNAAGNLCNVATGYFMKGEHDTAARWYRLVLQLDPTLAVAYQNLAAIHAGAGRTAEAQACRERAYQIQRVFIERAAGQEGAAAARRVLILCVGRTSGNVPFDTLLPQGTCCRIKYALDYAAPEEDAQLPPFDLVFNAIGEPDVAGPLAARLEHFMRRCRRPLLNPPAAIERTRRDRLAALLGDLADVVVAPCIRCDSPSAARAALDQRHAGSRLGWPVLARPAGTHGGAGLVRCEHPAELEQALRELDGAYYLTRFFDTRNADGNYRKYRIVFVDRVPFAYHLAISAHWMVHYFSADMVRHPWKIDAERRFLEDPGAVLGARAMAALAAIGQRLDLDYGGIDCALLPDGRVFVFEANATMLVHRERGNGPLAHKNAHVQHIVDAFEQLQARRCTAQSLA